MLRSRLLLSAWDISPLTPQRLLPPSCWSLPSVSLLSWKCCNTQFSVNAVNAYPYRKPPRLNKIKIKVSEFRIGRNMEKLLTGNRKPTATSVKYINSNPSQQLAELTPLTKGGIKGSGRRLSGKVLRRVNVLNTIFIEHITSLLATGEVSPEFLGLGVQISKVKIYPDFTGVNVYWVSTGTEKDDKIEKLLEKSSGHLRHVLTQLKVIGIVPPIFFVKDTQFSKLQEVEYLLSKCDLGKDHEPTLGYGEQTSSETAEGKEEETAPEATLLMRQDMLGVKHDVIMKEIMNAVKASRERKAAKERRNTSVTPTMSEDLNPHFKYDNETLAQAIAEAEDHRKRQKAFLKYLKGKQTEKSKELAMLTCEAKDREFFMESEEERWQSTVDSSVSQLENDFLPDDPAAEDDDLYYKEQDDFYDDFRKDFE